MHTHSRPQSHLALLTGEAWARGPNDAHLPGSCTAFPQALAINSDHVFPTIDFQKKKKNREA